MIEQQLSLHLRTVVCVIPTNLQTKSLQELPSDHSSAGKMKAVARSYFWWPDLDKEVEQLASGCITCQSVKNTPPGVPLHPWVWPRLLCTFGLAS